MFLFGSIDLSLTIQKTSLDFDNDRSIDVYFPPVSLDGKSACLQMNFVALTYFVVKLAYTSAVNNEYRYKERMLFRTMESLGKKFRDWETTITPDMTDGNEFVVVLHARSSSLGPMAVINSLKLQIVECNETGKYSLIQLYRCGCDLQNFATARQASIVLMNLLYRF